MLLSVLLWTSMIHVYKPRYRGTLRLVASPGCFPPIGPWTYNNWHIISLERREGTISLGVHTSRGLWGAALPWAILHTSLLSLFKWRGCLPALCTIHLTYWEHISVSQSSYLLSARHISPFDFVSSSVSIAACFSMSLSRNHLTHQGMLISPCAHSLLNCTGISYPKAARGDPDWALSYIRLII